ncbi:MAG: PIG-L deacetylase family protein, partial [Candidatus Thorarchaeota archaeon]
MKIVVFAPHPDDEVYGCGGSILKWMEEGHDIHVVYVTDNCALISWGRKNNELIEEEVKEYINLTEEEIGIIGLEEARKAAKAFGFPQSKVHLFEFHDQDAMNHIKEGIELSKAIIVDADRLVIPSDNNNHPDHQATHVMAKNAAQDLNMSKVEFYVYAIYNVLKAPIEKHIKIQVTDYRDKLYNLMKLYKTQITLSSSKVAWQTLKRRR